MSYSYDRVDRLTSETHVVPGTGSVTPKTSSSAYTYTPGGDRLTKTDEDGNVASYDYDDGHELAEITTVDALNVAGKSTAFTYDTNGNQTAKTVTLPSSATPNTPTVTNRAFDAGDNMVGYGDKTFAYDSADHKVKEADATNGVTAQSVYDGDSPFARYAITSGAPNGPPVVTIDGPTGMLGDTSTDAKDTLMDVLGSPLGQYDSAGALTGVRSYDAFGGQLATPNTVSDLSVQQGWMGNRDVDPAQGVSDFNARAFGAEDGRFMGVDPVEGIQNRPQTLNPYQHGTSNPYRYPDANGNLGIPSPSDMWNKTKGGLDFAASVVVPCYDLGKHYLSDSGSHDNTSWGALDQASAVAGCIPGIGKAGALGLKGAKAIWKSEDEVVSLYRAVSEDEAIDMLYKGLRPANGSLEDKWLAENAEHAAEWARIFYKWDKTPKEIMEIRVNKKVADKLRYEPNLDGVGPARAVDRDMLNTFNQNISSIEQLLSHSVR